MFSCFKNCLIKVLQRESVKNEVKIYDNIFIAHQKENQVFQQSLLFLEKSNEQILKNYEDSFINKFYNFELLIELSNRYSQKMNISEKNVSYLNFAFEELQIAFRFMMIGYYNSANIHLRIFIENIVNFVYFHFGDENIIQNHERDGLKLKIEKCFSKGQFSFKNDSPKEKDVYDEYYFNPEEFYRLYKFLSNNFVHKTNGNEDLIFNEKKLNEFYVLFTLSLMFSARFLKTTIGYDIENNWKNKIFRNIDGYEYYWNYLQYLFTENKVFTNQFSELYNLIHDHNKMNYDFIIHKIGLSIEKNFSPKYIEQCRISDECWGKSNGDSKKYAILIEEIYGDNGNTN